MRGQLVMAQRADQADDAAGYRPGRFGEVMGNVLACAGWILEQTPPEPNQLASAAFVIVNVQEQVLILNLCHIIYMT